MRNVDPTFDERKYGFGTLQDLLRACQREGLFRIERDRQGVIRLFPGNIMQPSTGVDDEEDLQRHAQAAGGGAARLDATKPGARRMEAEPTAGLHESTRSWRGGTPRSEVVDGDVVQEIDVQQVVDGEEAQPAEEPRCAAAPRARPASRERRRRRRHARARVQARAPRASHCAKTRGEEQSEKGQRKGFQVPN